MLAPIRLNSNANPRGDPFVLRGTSRSNMFASGDAGHRKTSRTLGNSPHHYLASYEVNRFAGSEEFSTYMPGDPEICHYEVVQYIYPKLHSKPARRCIVKSLTVRA